MRRYPVALGVLGPIIVVGLIGPTSPSRETVVRQQRLIETDASLNALPPGVRLAARGYVHCTLGGARPSVAWTYRVRGALEPLVRFYDRTLAGGGWARSGTAAPDGGHRELGRWAKSYGDFIALAKVFAVTVPTGRGGGGRGATLVVTFGTGYPSFYPPARDLSTDHNPNADETFCPLGSYRHRGKSAWSQPRSNDWQTLVPSAGNECPPL
jgi:hypothetical protein